MIIYFSGTGNSYSVAKKLSAKLNDAIVPMKSASNNGDEKITFVFPTYCYDVPPVVRQFIESMEINRNQKVMGISVSGGNNGNSEYTFNQLIEKKGLKVEKFLNIIMTDNSGPAMANLKINFREVDLDGMLDDFLKTAYTNQSKLKSSYKLSEKLLFNKTCKRIMRKRVDVDKCTGCGRCATICPNNNIKVMDKKAVIGPNCAECFGCIHWCPKQAIRMLKRIDKGNQYINSNIVYTEFNASCKAPKV